MRVLIDTNVIIDFLTSRPNFSEQANRVFLNCLMGKFIGYFTAAQYSDIHYVIKDATSNEEETRKKIKDLLNLLKVLDVNESDVKSSLSYEKNDAEDGLVVACAERHKIDIIVTRNKKDFKSSKLEIMSPADFISYIEKNPTWK